MSRTIALCYLRLSGRNEKEISIDIQKDACIALCKRFAWVPQFFEEGEGQVGQFSARKRLNLPVWASLYQRALTDSNIAAIVSYDLSRVFRRTETALFCAEELAKVNVRLMRATGGEFAVDTPENKFRATIEAGMAEYESFKATSRLLDHYAKVKQRRGHAGHKFMFGLDRQGSSKNDSEHWTPDENFPHVLTILRLYATGAYGMPALVSKLIDLGISWRGRDDQPTAPNPMTLWEFLHRIEFYKPFVDDIDPTLIARVVRVRDGRKAHKDNHRPQKQSSFLLRHVLYCAACGTRYVQSAERDWRNKQNGSIYRSYRHYHNPRCPTLKRRYTMVSIDHQFLVAVGELYEKLMPGELDALLSRPETPDTHRTRDRRATLDKRQAKFEDMLADNLISQERYLAAIARLDQERAQLGEPISPEPASKTIAPVEYRALLGSVVEILAAGMTLYPDAANRAVCNLFDRVCLDADGIISAVTLAGGIEIPLPVRS